MLRAFHTSATGMNAQQVLLDNTANNLANANTTGFKTSQVEFQDLLYSTMLQPGALAVQGQQIPVGVQLGNGVRVASNTRLFTAGSLNMTGNSLDVAIQGNGFFQVQAPDGSTRYTRDGSFRMNSNGDLVTANGLYMLPRITIPPGVTSISIGNDGTVSVTTANSPNAATQVGQIQLAQFPNAAGLSADGSNLYEQSPASGNPTVGNPGLNGTGTLLNGNLENSNVQVVNELVNLIQAQRAYEFNTKAIQVADQMLSDTNNLVR
jgi:flagellar basal-body rod protein FlgG